MGREKGEREKGNNFRKRGHALENEGVRNMRGVGNRTAGQER